MNEPTPTGSSYWKQVFHETRTRILLFSGFLLLLTTGLSIPLFRYLLFANITARVEENLNTERDYFLTEYTAWETVPDQTVQGLKTFIYNHFETIRLEDDNFQIFLLEGQFHRAEPSPLIEPLQPGGELLTRLQHVREPINETYKSGQADIGSIIYTADPLILNDQQIGTFITAHSSAGEQQEALVGIYLLMRIMGVVLLISLLLSWITAGKLMAPVGTLAKTARAISESDLTQRIPPPKRGGELAELTQTFNAMMDRIQSAFDSQRAFINDAGHELRTPITIIQGHLELLEDDPQERQETMELILDELDRMGRLVGDLLLLAKAERSNFLQLEAIEIQSFTEELFAKATALTERDWQLTVKGQGQIIGDRQQLTGALLNLLKNATQHTQRTDTIELGCRLTHTPQTPLHEPQRTQKQQVQFWVRDTGQGLRPEDQQRVFDRFARVGPRRSEGSGLGLAIASVIAEAHQGKIDLISQYGEGSTFFITFPARMESPAARPLG